MRWFTALIVCLVATFGTVALSQGSAATAIPTLNSALVELGKVQTHDKASSKALANGKALVRQARTELEPVAPPPAATCTVTAYEGSGFVTILKNAKPSTNYSVQIAQFGEQNYKQSNATTNASGTATYEGQWVYNSKPITVLWYAANPVASCVGTSSPPVEEPPVEEPPVEPPSTTTHCFANPHLCGFPDATNTGATGTLTPSGSITASTPGQVIKDKSVTGSINVTANNVTIENVKVVPTCTGSGCFAITVGGSNNLTIKNTTVAGQGTGSKTLEQSVHSTTSGNVLLERDYFYNCNECGWGNGLIVKDTYIIITSIYPGAHAEDTYMDCGSEITVEHSTLFNKEQQTATVFSDTGSWCGGQGNKYTVKNSLLAGGGFVFYPQANSSSPPGAQTTITGNHIARCLTPKHEVSGGGWPCTGGSDVNGWYPQGGYYGLGAYFSGPLVWSGNVWDDNLSTIGAP